MADKQKTQAILCGLARLFSQYDAKISCFKLVYIYVWMPILL